MTTARLALPGPVLERLARSDDHLLDEPHFGLTAPVGVQRRLEEGRISISNLEVRASDEASADDSSVPASFGITGYASSTDVPYDVAGGPPYGWTETIKRGAFGKALKEKDDVRLFYNHDGYVFARTKAGTLTLAEDKIGLLSTAPEIDTRAPEARSLYVMLDNGSVDQMSFAFRVTRQEWNEDYTERTVLEVRLFDVSAVSFPANEATAIQLLAAAPVPEVRGISLELARAQVELSRRRG